MHSTGLRVLITVLITLALGLAHWLTPSEPLWLHGVHVLMRKLLLMPVVLAAIWFGLPGAFYTAGLVTLLYLPHVLVQWGGQTVENLNQYGEVATLWIAAGLAGWLIGRERRALQHAAEVSRGALRALVKALDAREHATEQHSARVRAYALRLGRELKLSAEELVRSGDAAVLHDVGKIGIPDRILAKTGPLSEQERGQIEHHAAIGGDILASVPTLQDVAEIVRCHHERYDGQGYPDGRAGDAIPLPARILAVADVFDALTSERPYRPAMSRAEARDHIASECGRQFDPTVVAAFLRIFPDEWALLAQTADDGQPGVPTPAATA